MFPVEISEKAASEIKKVMEEQSLEDSALRVGLQGGGCSGFQYLLNFIKEEVNKSKQLFNKYKWPIIDVTRRSVEETAASILKIFEIRKNK